MNCRQIGYYDTPGYAFGVAIANNYAYVADGGSGLRIIEFYGVGIEESNFSLRKERKIPTFASNLLNLTEEADLLDIAGRKVCKLNPGKNDISHLKPGFYFIRNNANHSKINKVLICQ